MIPINNRCLKEQEDSRFKVLKQPQVRAPLALTEYCPRIHTPFDNYMENYLKNQLDAHEPYFMPIPTEENAERCQNLENHFMPENYYDHNSCFSMKNNWIVNNNNCFQDVYHYKIKREQYDEQKFWPPQIKDEESPEAYHEHAFQTCEILKQEQIQYIPKCATTFDDPNKFLGPCVMHTREEKNTQRKLKVQAYLKKKIMRSFEKKIIYKCRKQVADNRIRYRGRFISLSQAAQILGLDPKGSYSSVFLMEKFKTQNHPQGPKQIAKPQEKCLKQQYINKSEQHY